MKCQSMAVVARDACRPMFVRLMLDEIESHGFAVSDFSRPIIQDCLLSRIHGQSISVSNGGWVRAFDCSIEVSDDLSKPLFATYTAGRLELARTTFLSEVADGFFFVVDHNGNFLDDDFHDNVIVRHGTISALTVDPQTKFFYAKEDGGEVQLPQLAPIEYRPGCWPDQEKGLITTPAERPPHVVIERPPPVTPVTHASAQELSLRSPSIEPTVELGEQWPLSFPSAQDRPAPPFHTRPDGTGHIRTRDRQPRIPLTRQHGKAPSRVAGSTPAQPVVVAMPPDLKVPRLVSPGIRPQEQVDIDEFYDQEIKLAPWEGDDSKSICLMKILNPDTKECECCRKPATMICSPCGHLVLCESCGQNAIDAKQQSKRDDRIEVEHCPVCQTPITFATLLRREQKCCICLTALADTTILPCGHQCACFCCATKLWTAKEQCPLCQGRMNAFKHQFPIFGKGVIRDCTDA
jgi:hypothetical protein